MGLAAREAIKNGVGLLKCRRRWDIAPAGELAEVPGEILLNLQASALKSLAPKLAAILPNLPARDGDALYRVVKLFSFDN